MTVQDAVSTVTIPQQAPPADPPLAAASPAPSAPAPAPRLVGRDRPMLQEEREFVVGLTVMCLVLSVIIFVGVAFASWSAPQTF
jgi:hypothetical protein